MPTTTPNFGWSVPVSTDLVKDGATAIELLGDSIDASLVDLKGGTTGQVLAKASGTDMDFSWVAQDDSNAIQNAIVDAKGDLIGATAADTPARLAVGTNGQVLTADSTASTGLKWATPSSGSTFSGVLLTNSASQSISNNTTTAVTWATETFDTDGFHSTSSNTSRITIPAGKAGYYHVGAQLEVDNSTSGGKTMYIYKNGAIVKRFIIVPSANYPSANMHLTMNLAVNDYVEIYYIQTTGTTQNVISDAENGTFYAYYIGA